MRRRLALAWLLAGLGAAPALAATDARKAPAPAPRVLAFVGELLTLADPTQYDCGDGCIVWDSSYDSTYRPLQWLEGDPEPGPVAVRQWWHAQPLAWDHKWTLVVVIDRPEGRELYYRTLRPVYPTADGGYASCGTSDDAELARAVKPIRFHDDAVVENVARWSAAAIAEQFPAPVYARRGDEIHCTQGIPAEDLARVLVARAKANASG